MKGILVENKEIKIKEEKLRLLMDSLILDFGELEIIPMKISKPKMKKIKKTKIFVPKKKGSIF